MFKNVCLSVDLRKDTKRLCDKNRLGYMLKKNSKMALPLLEKNIKLTHTDLMLFWEDHYELAT